MKYICPTCYKEFNSEENIQKHFIVCWKEEHPFHISKEAPHSPDVTSRVLNSDIDTDMQSFIMLLEKRNGRSIN